LRREQDGLRKAGIDVVLVGSGSPEKAESFRHDFEVPFPIVCDQDCVLYQKYGLKQMKTRDFFSPSLLVKAVKVLAEGYGHKSGQGSERQLPGVFIIDTGGKVRFAHIAANAADHPSPQEIIRAAATINRQVRVELEGVLP
jgi:peroxiredoxin